MQITVETFWVVLLVIIIHTILQHLLNWASRKAEGEEQGLVVMLFLVEAAFLIAALLSIFY